MCDSNGAIYKGRKEGMNKYKDEFGIETKARTLGDAMVGINEDEIQLLMAERGISAAMKPAMANAERKIKIGAPRNAMIAMRTTKNNSIYLSFPVFKNDEIPDRARWTEMIR